MSQRSIEQILDLARWAPSGDNSQPWRFEVVSDEHVVVHAFDTRRHCVYDLEGGASQLAVGAMLETMRIAARARGLSMQYERRVDADEELPLIDVRFHPDPAGGADPLADTITRRCVQRKPLSTKALTQGEKGALEAAVGADHRLIWFEGWGGRLRGAWLAVRSAKIRLTIPEAYAVHREIIEWGARYSDDRVPALALGADRLTLHSMKWAMASWSRVRTMNRWAGGTYLPRLQLDFLPGVLCAAHFAIVARYPGKGIDANLAAGAAVQRFWLTATALNLQLQPQYTPIVFAGYARDDVPFTADKAAKARAREVEGRLAEMVGPDAERLVFFGRVGHGDAADSRSLRLSVEKLRWSGENLTRSAPRT